MIIRRATADEAASFVASAWIYSYASSDWALSVTPKDATHTQNCEQCGCARFKMKKLPSGAMIANAGREYIEGHKALIRKLIACSNVSVAVADDDLLDGFIVRDEVRPVVHYVYVRESARGKGVAKALVADLRDAPAVYSHKSRGVKAARLPRRWRFSPYSMFGVFT